MKKYLLAIAPLFLSGCPMGDKINRHPAQSEVLNNKVCVFVEQKDIVKNENILKVLIWEHGKPDYVYEKNYATNPIPLEAGKCVPGIGNFAFVQRATYSITVQTPLNPYRTDFIFNKYGDEVRLEK